MKNLLPNTLSTASNNFAKVQNFGKVKTTEQANEILTCGKFKTSCKLKFAATTLLLTN